MSTYLLDAINNNETLRTLGSELLAKNRHDLLQTHSSSPSESRGEIQYLENGSGKLELDHFASAEPDQPKSNLPAEKLAWFQEGLKIPPDEGQVEKMMHLTKDWEHSETKCEQIMNAAKIWTSNPEMFWAESFSPQNETGDMLISRCWTWLQVNSKNKDSHAHIRRLVIKVIFFKSVRRLVKDGDSLTGIIHFLPRSSTDKDKNVLAGVQRIYRHGQKWSKFWEGFLLGLDHTVDIRA